MTLHRESWQYVAPLWWCADPHDSGTVLHNASCFFVEIGSHRFGVTAAHVVAEYLKDREQHPKGRLMVRNTDITDWESRRIDDDAALDVATFRVSDAEFKAIGARPLRSALDQWPPKPPDVDRGVFVAGCVGTERRVLNEKAVEFHICSNGLVLTSLGPEELEVKIDRTDLHPMGGTPIPPMTRDLGGFSGAPLLVVSAKPLAGLFWLGGVIIRQLRARDENDTTTLWARRPNCIMPDGRLRRPHVIEAAADTAQTEPESSR